MRHCTDFFSCLLLFFVFNLFPLLLKSLSLHYTFVLAWQWFHFSFFPLLLLINFFFCVAKLYCEWTFGFVEGFMLYLFRRLKRKRTKFEIIFCLTCAIIVDEFIWRGKKYTKINKTEKIDGNFFKKEKIVCSSTSHRVKKLWNLTFTLITCSTTVFDWQKKRQEECKEQKNKHNKKNRYSNFTDYMPRHVRQC